MDPSCLEPPFDRDYVAFSGRGFTLGSGTQEELIPAAQPSPAPDEPSASTEPDGSQIADGSQIVDGSQIADGSLKMRMEALIEVAASWQVRFEAGSALRTQIDDYCCKLVECTTSADIHEVQVLHFEAVFSSWKAEVHQLDAGQRAAIARGKSGVFADQPYEADHGCAEAAPDEDDDSTMCADQPYEVENSQVDEFLNAVDSPTVKDVSDADDQPLVPATASATASSAGDPRDQPKPKPKPKRKPKVKAEPKPKIPAKSGAAKRRRLSEKKPRFVE